MMNAIESEVLQRLMLVAYTNQRDLAGACGISLGSVNLAIKNLQRNGYLNGNVQLTSQAVSLQKQHKPRRAVILAAGFGLRMVPINLDGPKALLVVKGEVLVERLIQQLHQVGVKQIAIVVGFMKERFEYLIDRYNVELIINPLYATKNNLYSLFLAKNHLDDSYIVPADLWCDENPFRTMETYSWYMMSMREDRHSMYVVNRKRSLNRREEDQHSGHRMIGIAYFARAESIRLRARLERYVDDPHFDQSFWEETFLRDDKKMLAVRIVPDQSIIEINTYEDLRDFDAASLHLKSSALDSIAKKLFVQPSEIYDISIIKKGMTNRSFFFKCRNIAYIMRIPGEGTDQLINRAEEAHVYNLIRGLGICDDVVYIDAETGYKVTVFLDDIRVCDPNNDDDLRVCMDKLRSFHQMKLKVPHTFDLQQKIDFYESLWDGAPSTYQDYLKTKKSVLALNDYVKRQNPVFSLTHIDAVPDNFLIQNTPDSDEIVQLIDWEYASMQDPHVDIAMFAIYSLYDRTQLDNLINIYFENSCDRATRVKIYCYVALGGLLWSNWCEYKQKLGVEFGEYALRQYRYAKDYSRLVVALIDETRQKEQI